MRVPILVNSDCTVISHPDSSKESLKNDDQEKLKAALSQSLKPMRVYEAVIYETTETILIWFSNLLNSSGEETSTTLVILRNSFEISIWLVFFLVASEYFP